jgi:hypothetical protein
MDWRGGGMGAWIGGEGEWVVEGRRGEVGQWEVSGKSVRDEEDGERGIILCHLEFLLTYFLRSFPSY